MRMIYRSLGLFAVLACGTAQAEDQSPAAACVGVGNDAARLACYDLAFRSGPKSVAKAPEAAQKTDADARFGDSGQLHRDLKAKSDLPKNLSARLQKVSHLASGLYRLQLDNGQVWQTIETDWATSFAAQDSITITRMPIGGYQISLAGDTRSVAVRRYR